MGLLAFAEPPSNEDWPCKDNDEEMGPHCQDSPFCYLFLKGNTYFPKCIMFVTLSTECVTQGFGLNVRRRLDCARHVGCTYDSVHTHSQSAGTCVVGWEKKLRHSASVRLTCMLSITDYQCQYQGTKKKRNEKNTTEKKRRQGGRKSG